MTNLIIRIDIPGPSLCKIVKAPFSTLQFLTDFFVWLKNTKKAWLKKRMHALKSWKVCLYGRYCSLFTTETEIKSGRILQTFTTPMLPCWVLRWADYKFRMSTYEKQLRWKKAVLSLSKVRIGTSIFLSPSFLGTYHVLWSQFPCHMG